MKLHKDNTTCYGKAPPQSQGDTMADGRRAGLPQLQVLSKRRRSQLEGA